MQSMFASSTIPMLEQVVQFTQNRHEVLAGNIANLDTPGYRTRDLSPDQFQAKLKAAIDGQRQPVSLGGTLVGTPDALASITTTDASLRTDMNSVADSMESILRHDDSNVSLEHQVAEMSKNQMEHNLALTIMTSQFRLLEAAISERAG